MERLSKRFKLKDCITMAILWCHRLRDLHLACKERLWSKRTWLKKLRFSWLNNLATTTTMLQRATTTIAELWTLQARSATHFSASNSSSKLMNVMVSRRYHLCRSSVNCRNIRRRRLLKKRVIIKIQLIHLFHPMLSTKRMFLIVRHLHLSQLRIVKQLWRIKLVLKTVFNVQLHQCL